MNHKSRIKGWRKWLPIVLAILFVCGVFIWLYNRGSKESEVRVDINWGDGGVTSGVVQQVFFNELLQTYRHTGYGFSFSYPEGFTVREAENAEGNSILIESEVTKKGIQIYITSFTDTDTDITEARIRADIPDMEVVDAQEVLLGAQSGKGLAFLSDNPAFDEASREVWFVYRGNLYQISTYIEYDALLQEMMGTWKFE